MNKLKIFIASVAILLSPVLLFANAGAYDPFEDQCANNPNNAICQNKDEDVNDLIKNIVNALLFIVGAISVIMLIYGGLRYSASGGSANSVTAAKNTILYAIVGLVVAFSAYAIVNWVIGEIS